MAQELSEVVELPSDHQNFPRDFARGRVTDDVSFYVRKIAGILKSLA